MNRFVITGHRAVSTGDFSLDDICGGAGRLDILVRCVNSAFFLSHGFRKDSELFLILEGGDDAPKCVRFFGPELRYLNPDERSTASLIRNALLKKFTDGEVRSSPGVYISRKGFGQVLEELSEDSEFIYLKEDGTDIRESELPENPCFILGDDTDPTEEEDALIAGYDPLRVRLGPKSLHADHCIILTLNEFDRRCENDRH